jgi:hypothetical protein
MDSSDIDLMGRGTTIYPHALMTCVSYVFIHGFTSTMTFRRRTVTKNAIDLGSNIA